MVLHFPYTVRSHMVCQISTLFSIPYFNFFLCPFATKYLVGSKDLWDAFSFIIVFSCSLTLFFHRPQHWTLFFGGGLYHISPFMSKFINTHPPEFCYWRKQVRPEAKKIWNATVWSAPVQDTSFCVPIHLVYCFLSSSPHSQHHSFLSIPQLRFLSPKIFYIFVLWLSSDFQAFLHLLIFCSWGLFGAILTT